METHSNSPAGRRLTAEEVRALALRAVHGAIHAAVYWLVQHLLNGTL